MQHIIRSMDTSSFTYLQRMTEALNVLFLTDGDTDILGPMAESGELQTVLQEAFGYASEPKTTINLH